ncbi:hypothetical protein L1987_45778 [Smallanthus sonchifolius]|uniref:Uncharacterized protein n=1 Tax=Smallanthus sonchifolius TaxID=185202 RepID=A0ACB9FXS7_9ASTR|nr:hypothetical protein L1987_45778 [Smallanthus sonchifolius]
MSDHVPVIEIPDTDTKTEVPPYDTFATSFQNTFQDIDGYGNYWLWETGNETETTDELGHEAPVVEAQAADELDHEAPVVEVQVDDEPGHEAPAVVEPIQTDSIASTHSTRPSREIRIVYTRRKRKPETGPVLSLSLKRRGRMACLPLRLLMQSMVGQLTFLEEDKVIEYDIRNQLHFRTSDLESERAEMKKKLHVESQKVEAAEASLVAAQQQMVTMGENVEAAVALATTCLMMFVVMIRAGGIARFPH